MPTDEQFKNTFDKLKRLRADHLKVQHDLVFYPYQEAVSDKILEALLRNLRITANASEEDINKLKQIEIAIEQSRQCVAIGTMVVLTKRRKKAIEEVKVGDHIISYDGGIQVISQVEHVWHTGMKPCYRIRTVRDKEIICTEDHKFMTVNGWQSIKTGLKAKPSPSVSTISSTIFTAGGSEGKSARTDEIESIEFVGDRDTYDLQVAKYHNYIAEGLVVHNSGKTYGIAHTCEFILTFLPTLFKRPIHIGIFAAQLDQAKISYKILRNSMRQAKAMMMVTKEQEKHIAEEENSRTLVLPDGSSVIIAPINKTSLIEGATLDLIIIDESQFADDEIVKHSIWPMGASTGAPRLYIGKAGTRISHFYRLSQKNDSLKVYFDDVVAQRRKLFEDTGDARHLIYEQTVRSEIERDGIDADHIQREYFGKWQIGSGQFVTQEDLDSLIVKRGLTYNYKKTNCFVGIDTAKSPDSSVLTVIRDSGEMTERTLPDGKTKEYFHRLDLLNWMELKGENYQDQFDAMRYFLKMYNVVAISIDSTGQGDFMPDMFERHTQWQDENTGLYRVKFSAISKDMMYKNLKVNIKQQLLTLPNLGTKIGERFRMQMLDLQQERKGQLLSCHHPDTPDARDDFCDSLALACWSAAQYYAKGEPQLVVMGGSKKERTVVKDDDGSIEDYWPGLDL